MATISALIKQARRDALAALKADAGVTSLIDADQIHSQQPATEPEWPFAKLTAPQGLKLRAACVRGAVVNFGVSAFTRGRSDITAESHAAEIGDAIERCIDGRREVLPGFGNVAYSIRDVLLRSDGAEASAMHFSATITARVLA